MKDSVALQLKSVITHSQHYTRYRLAYLSRQPGKLIDIICAIITSGIFSTWQLPVPAATVPAECRQKTYQLNSGI